MTTEETVEQLRDRKMTHKAKRMTDKVNREKALGYAKEEYRHFAKFRE